MIKLKFLLLILIHCTLQGQQILLEKIVEDSLVIPEFGPNAKKFNHLYYALGQYFPYQQKRIELKTLASWYNEIGFRHKRQINSNYSLGYAIAYHKIGLTLESIDALARLRPDNTDSEKLKVHTMDVELYNRFNFGKRGKYMGIFLDIGFDYGFNFYSRWVTKRNLPYSAYGNHELLVVTDPDCVNRSSAHGILRLGANRLVIWAKYEILPLFKPVNDYPDLKGIAAGIQFGLHK